MIARLLQEPLRYNIPVCFLEENMTITEKILAAHAGRKKVSPGELINAKVDLILANDITAPIAISEFKKIGAKDVFDRDRIAMVPDHFAPQKDIKAAEQCKLLKVFSREYNLSLYFEVGRMGVEHALLPEEGLVVPGDVVIGADSHTCTYGALGAFSTGVGSTDVAAAMATGECWFKVPESMKFIYHGKLNKWVGGKDLILHTIGDIGVDGALYRAMEFEGDTIQSLPMYGRLTICNMAIEAGERAASLSLTELRKHMKKTGQKDLRCFTNRIKKRSTSISGITTARRSPSLSRVRISPQIRNPLPNCQQFLLTRSSSVPVQTAVLRT